MAKDGDLAAATALRDKIEELEAELARVLKDREEVQASIDEAEKVVHARVERDNELAALEGKLRGQVGELGRALEAFETS